LPNIESNNNRKGQNFNTDSIDLNYINKNQDFNSSYISQESYIKQENPTFNFPSISNTRKNYSSVMNSHEFVVPFFHWLMNFSLNKSDVLYNEEFFVNKLGVSMLKQNSEMINIHPTLSSFRSNVSPNGSYLQTNNNQGAGNSNIFENLKEQSILAKQNINNHLNAKTSEKRFEGVNNTAGKAKGNKPILSNILYVIILKKLSFKSNPPKGFVMAFGSNSFCQTTQTNYELMCLPRHCFKLKEETVDKLACGWEHVVALTRARTLYSWGNNTFGQCGVNTLLNQPGNNYINLSSNINHLLATVNSNKLNLSSMYSGLNGISLLAKLINSSNNTTQQSNSIHQLSTGNILSNPVKVPTLSNISQISAGNDFSIAFDISGNVFSWGKNEGGVLGYSLNNNNLSIVEPDNKLFINNNVHPQNNIDQQPYTKFLNSEQVNNNQTNITGKEQESVKELNSMDNISIKNNNSNNKNILEYSYIPKQIPNLKNVKYVSSGSFHNIAVDSRHKIFSWGSGEGGQLGHSEEFMIHNSDLACVSAPTVIQALEKENKLAKVSSGEAHSITLTSNGELYGWGFSSSGQLGLGFCADSFEPGSGVLNSKVSLPRKIHLRSSNNKQAKLKSNINVNNIGVKNLKNRGSQNSKAENLYQSIKAEELDTVETNNDDESVPYIVDVVCGKTFSMFIDKDGKLYGCGNNDYGQLGTCLEIDTSRSHLFNPKDDYNNCSDIVFPRAIECFSKMKVKKIACGDNHCLAVIEDSINQVTSVWSWGMNKYGQLGQGNNLETQTPKPISYFYDYNNCRIVDVACGAYFSLCLFSNFSQSRTNNVNDIMEHFILSLQMWKAN